MKMNDEYMLDEKVSKKSRAISLSMAEEKQKKRYVECSRTT
jgi:hypothetical protein